MSHSYHRSQNDPNSNMVLLTPSLESVPLVSIFTLYSYVSNKCRMTGLTNNANTTHVLFMFSCTLISLGHSLNSMHVGTTFQLASLVQDYD